VELTAHPWTLAARGDVNKGIEIMHGTCTDEGVDFESSPRTLTQDVLNANWATWCVPLYCLTCNLSAKQCKEINWFENASTRGAHHSV
jgi:hypothetical protein